MQVFRPGSYKYLLCLPPSLLGRHRHTLADFGQTQPFYNLVFEYFEFSLVRLIFGLYSLFSFKKGWIKNTRPSICEPSVFSPESELSTQFAYKTVKSSTKKRHSYIQTIIPRKDTKGRHSTA